MKISNETMWEIMDDYCKYHRECVGSLCEDCVFADEDCPMDLYNAGDDVIEVFVDE